MAYRVLPAPYADGRPLATGAKRQTVAEVKAVLEEALGLAVSGWAVSATRTAGIEASFGPQGTKLVFRSATAVAPRIPSRVASTILLDRFGDWLTDGLRVLALEAFGYAVDVVEYVSPLDTPKNIMIRAEKARRPDHRAYERYRAVGDFFGVRPALDTLLAGAWPGADGQDQAR